MTSPAQPSALVAASASSPSNRASSLTAVVPASFSHDVVVLLDVLVRIEQRRQARLRALRLEGLREAS